MGVLVGKTARLSMRLILVRVPNAVARQQRQPMVDDAEMRIGAQWTYPLSLRRSLHAFHTMLSFASPARGEIREQRACSLREYPLEAHVCFD